LLVVAVAIPVALEQGSAVLRQDDRVVPISGHTHSLDQPFLAKVSQVARAWVGRTIVVVAEITTGDNSKGTNGRERAGLGPA
jgi:hypothetical protein